MCRMCICEQRGIDDFSLIYQLFIFFYKFLRNTKLFVVLAHESGCTGCGHVPQAEHVRQVLLAILRGQERNASSGWVVVNPITSERILRWFSRCAGQREKLFGQEGRVERKIEDSAWVLDFGECPILLIWPVVDWKEIDLEIPAARETFQVTRKNGRGNTAISVSVRVYTVSLSVHVDSVPVLALVALSGEALQDKHIQA